MFDFVSDFSSGLAAVCKKFCWGIIDTNGVEKISLEYDAFEWRFFANYWSDNNLSLNKWPKGVNIGGVIDSQRFIRGGKWGLVDSLGKLIVEPKYESVPICSDSFLMYQDSNTWFVSRIAARAPAVRKFDEIRHFTGSKFIVKNNNKLFLYDLKKNVILGKGYEWIFKRNSSYAYVSDSVLYGVIDINSNEIIPPTVNFFDMSFFYNIFDNIDASISYSDSKKMFLDKLGELEFFPCGKNKWLLEKNGHYGFFAPDYDIEISPSYEKIGFVSEENGWIRAQLGEKWGWIDNNGKIKIPFRYDISTPFKNGKALVRQEPFPYYFYINYKGEMVLGK